MQLDFCTYSDVGGRKDNEDRYIALQQDNTYLFAVADGLGGYECGEMASEILVDNLKRKYLFSPYTFDLEEAISEANNKILIMQQNTKTEMKTTITALYINDKSIICANVGDSRTYVFKDNNVIFQTTDHSVAQMAVHVGEINKEDIRIHQDRNKLTRAVGTKEQIKIDTYILDDKFDFIMLCSDGFWEYVYEDEMCNMNNLFHKPHECLNEMRKLLFKRIPKNNDNNTAIIITKED